MSPELKRLQRKDEPLQKMKEKKQTKLRGLGVKVTAKRENDITILCRLFSCSGFNAHQVFLILVLRRFVLAYRQRTTVTSSGEIRLFNSLKKEF